MMQACTAAHACACMLMLVAEACRLVRCPACMPQVENVPRHGPPAASSTMGAVGRGGGDPPSSSRSSSSGCGDGRGSGGNAGQSSSGGIGRNGGRSSNSSSRGRGSSQAAPERAVLAETNQQLAAATASERRRVSGPAVHYGTSALVAGCRLQVAGCRLLRGLQAAAFFGAEQGADALPSCCFACQHAQRPAVLLSQYRKTTEAERQGIYKLWLRSPDKWEQIRQQVERDPALRSFLEGCRDKKQAQLRVGWH